MRETERLCQLEDRLWKAADEIRANSLLAASRLGLSHPNSVSTYQHRYADMPTPVVDLGEGRSKLWLEDDVRSRAHSRRASSR